MQAGIQAKKQRNLVHAMIYCGEPKAVEGFRSAQEVLRRWSVNRVPGEIKTVGVIGIGNMGAPMAGNLARSGFSVVLFDIDLARAQRVAVQIGARAVDGLDALGDADAIVTMLPTGRDVRNILLEYQGGALATALALGSIVVDMSSSDPVGTRELGAALSARGLALVDAPVSGGVPRAKDGTLAIMIGGDAADIVRVKPLLAALGNRLFEVGALGCGHAMKALNNFLAATGFAAASEAMAVGRQFGLDPAIMIDVINASTGRNFSTENTIKQQVLTGNFASGFSLGLLAKDVKIAADLAVSIGIDVPLGRLIRDLWADAREEIGAERDHTRAVEAWESKRMRRAAE
jgi:3-hydroxyisobutyrate dehydrogenase